MKNKNKQVENPAVVAENAAGDENPAKSGVDIAGVLERLERIEEKNKQLEEDNKILKGTIDKSRLAHYQSQNPDSKEPLSFGLRSYNDKIIKSWKSIKDKVFKDPLSGVWREEQITKLTFFDGTEIDLPLASFEKFFVLVKSKLISRTKTDTDEILKVRRLDNGEEYEISILFVN